MSRILVIPDSHLKPFLFDEADALLEKGSADYAVCLGDLLDDWGQQYNLDCYNFMLLRVIEFLQKYPETLWVYGNHECNYLWKGNEAGYSVAAAGLVNIRLNQLIQEIPKENINFIHRRDKLIFSHGGLTVPFVHSFVKEELWDDINAVVHYVNNLAPDFFWNDYSPIKARTGVENIPLWMSERYVHVVGHTPVQYVYEKDGCIYTDVYSTSADLKPIGNQKMIIIDSETACWDYAL